MIIFSWADREKSCISTVDHLSCMALHVDVVFVALVNCFTSVSLCFLLPLIHLVMALNTLKPELTRMWADAQRDGRPAEYRWRPLINAAKFG